MYKKVAFSVMVIATLLSWGFLLHYAAAEDALPVAAAEAGF